MCERVVVLMFMRARMLYKLLRYWVEASFVKGMASPNTL
jgi:hypothetical protein